jgi:hypothetical protein
VAPCLVCGIEQAEKSLLVTLELEQVSDADLHEVVRIELGQLAPAARRDAAVEDLQAAPPRRRLRVTLPGSIRHQPLL